MQKYIDKSGNYEYEMPFDINAKDVSGELLVLMAVFFLAPHSCPYVERPTVDCFVKQFGIEFGFALFIGESMTLCKCSTESSGGRRLVRKL